MKAARSLLAVSLASVPLVGGTTERLTETCQSGYANSLNGFASAQLLDEIKQTLANPEDHADMSERLWKPNGGFAGSVQAGFDLTYSVGQDYNVVMQSLAADPTLKEKGLGTLWLTAGPCQFGPPTAEPARVQLTEYRNTITNHYFLSASDGENQVIDRGGAGPGWERTGETSSTHYPTGCDARTAPRVYRFYGPGPNSHFYTGNPAECGMVRKPGTGWLLEGVAFAAFAPREDGTCAPSLRAVWRLYNNGAARNDSNHRHVFRPELIAPMQAQGWSLEGIAMCLP